MSHSFSLFLVPCLVHRWGWFSKAQPPTLLSGLPLRSGVLGGSPRSGLGTAGQARVRQGGGRGEGRGPEPSSPRPARPPRWGPGRPAPSRHPRSGLSGPAPGLLALSLFFLRRLSIQPALERAPKPDSARELSRMFLPDMMSSPKPSWCEKA